jgi:MYXO-CTERM domain-containing protein
VNGVDQRGQDRNDDRCDAGAFELKFADSDTVTRTVTGAGTYTFGPAMVTIVVTDTGGCLTGISVQRYNVNHPNATVALQTGHWWRITPIPGACTGFNVSVTLPADFTPGVDDKVCRHTGSGWDCAMASYTSNTLTRTGVTAFSDWAVGRNVDPTAVTLLSLSADSQGFRPVVGGVGMLMLGAAVSRRRKRR